MRVPKDLVHVLGPEWGGSLKTGDYQSALLRHSEEAAKFHLLVVTERAKLGGAAQSPQADNAARQAYQIVKRYFDQRIETVASGTTRLEMQLAEGSTSARHNYIDVLAELDRDLVDILDVHNANGQQRTHGLVVALAKENNVSTEHGSEFTRVLTEQVRSVLVELAAEDRAHFLGEAAPSSFIAAAKAKGKYKGRAPTARLQSSRVLALKVNGTGASEIAALVGIGRASVYRILSDAKNLTGGGSTRTASN